MQDTTTITKAPANRSEFGQIALAIETLMREAQRLQELVKPYILEKQTHQINGGLKAAFRRGSRTLDHETPGRTAPVDIIARYTKIIPEQIIPEETVIDWKAVCKEAQLEPIITGKKPDMVKFELIDD